MMTMTTTNAKYKPAHAGAKYDIQGFCLKHVSYTYYIL